MTDAPEPADPIKRRRTKNLALAGVLLAMVVLFYVVTIVRMGGN